ncbi:hypothetical protein [Roseospira visakhapatnamensis]|uniref:Peptidase C39-like protein n=1 Tax=Roseospira visakhapatnamensis TaxID=390880 RepID=A0A7W6W9A6_9PROT|nr:hypothetical protein [Roseospira visakhapatnamensis]
MPPVNGCFLDRLMLIAADHGQPPVDALGRAVLADAHGVRGDGFAVTTVLAVAADLGLAADHRRLDWSRLPTLSRHLPALLIFRDGATAILDGLEPGTTEDADAGPAQVLLRDEGQGDAPLALGRDDLALFWAGDVIVPAALNPRLVDDR